MKRKFKGKQRGKQSGSKSNKKQKFQPERKTYSLHKAKDDQALIKKRRFYARPKSDEQVVEERDEKVPESSSEEEVDDMQQLLATFSGTKPRTAIDSNSEESEAGIQDDEEQEENILTNNEMHSSTDDNLAEEEEEENEDDLNGDLERSRQNADADDGTFVDADEADDEDDEALKLTKEEFDDTRNDPFVKHCLYEINESLLNSIQSIPPLVDNTEITWPELGRLHVQIPKCTEHEPVDTGAFTIEERKVFAPGGKLPQRIHAKASLQELHIKPQILKNLQKANTALTDDVSDLDHKIPLTPLQREVFSVLNNYQDLYFPERTFNNGEALRFAYCLHAINHVVKSRLKVINHNVRLKNKDDVPEEFRDQGLVRPKVLILLPFRDAAYRVINMLIDLLFDVDKGNVLNRKRFVEEFTGNELFMPKRNAKPEDYELLFAGNTNDDFKVGITITKKSMKLYADFYASDIIVASPLGLRPLIGAAGEPTHEHDFLASIELLVADQADVFLAQNWDHVLHVVRHLHLQPRAAHDVDVTRVRTWSLNGWAAFYRQTVVVAGVRAPPLAALVTAGRNYAGCVRVANAVRAANAAIRRVRVRAPHVFHRFEAESVGDVADARLAFVVGTLLPSLQRHTLLYVASYFDFVRLRNHLKRHDASFVQACEYSKENKIVRARGKFFYGEAKLLLYTERFHFFNRSRIKGIRHLVFYQPPSFPHFYDEMCNLMQDAANHNVSVSVVYCRYDAQQLAAIVGTERALRLVHSDRPVHMLLTE